MLKTLPVMLLMFLFSAVAIGATDELSEGRVVTVDGDRGDLTLRLTLRGAERLRVKAHGGELWRGEPCEIEVEFIRAELVDPYRYRAGVEIVAGILAFVLIVTIPWGIASFRIAFNPVVASS